MSSTMPTTPATSASAASAKKITQITQSLSSGVTNLLTELARVNVSADNDVSNSAIMAQLLALHTLVEGISTRLAAVEKTISKADDGVPEPTEIEPVVSLEFPNRSVNEYNAVARAHNATLGGGNDTVMPLRTSRNTYIVGFPSTVGHLASLDGTVQAILLKGFALPALPAGRDQLWTFIGVKIYLPHIYELYSTGEELAETRMEKKFKRSEEVYVAGPPTAKTRKAALVHNRIARAANATSSGALMPIHDEHNIPVFGWPRSLRMLAQPYRRWDVLYLLGEYGQSVEKTGCTQRLVQFVGANAEEVARWMKSSEGEYGSYWEM